MTDFLDKIPTKLLIALVLVAFLSTGGFIAYAVIYQNNPVEILGIVKFGERADELTGLAPENADPVRIVGTGLIDEMSSLSS